MVSSISGILSITGLVLMLSVFASVWNYSANGAVLLTGGVSGVAGAVSGWLGRRNGRTTLGELGLWVGLAVAAVTVVALLAGNYEVEFG